VLPLYLLREIFEANYYILKTYGILPVTKYFMGKEYQHPLPPLTELREKQRRSRNSLEKNLPSQSG
jgi:hypothetical protein